MLKTLTASIVLFALAGSAAAESGKASIYGNGDGYAGRCVAEQKPGGGCKRMNPGEMAAAHRTLPFGTRVLVKNNANGRQVVVRINDRGPFIAGRIIDVTPAAARKLGFSGLAPVVISVL